MEAAEVLEDGRVSKRGTKGCEAVVCSMLAVKEEWWGMKRDTETRVWLVLYRRGVLMSGMTKGAIPWARSLVWAYGDHIGRVISVLTPCCHSRRESQGLLKTLPRWSHQRDQRPPRSPSFFCGSLQGAARTPPSPLLRIISRL